MNWKMTHLIPHKMYVNKLSRGLGLVLLALLLVEICTNSSSFAAGDACSDHAQLAQQSCQQKSALDQALWQAAALGLPATQLQPLYVAETQVGQNATSSYASQIAHYQQLLAQEKQMVLTYYRNQAQVVLKQFHSEVNIWSQAHLYADSYDKHSYSLIAGYMQQGMGGIFDSALASAHTVQAYQAAISQEQDMLFNLHMLEKDYSDKTAFNAVHQTDRQILAHYQLQKGQVMLVSFSEQALRFYQDGKLVKSFLVTTGRPDDPALPGYWPTVARSAPIIFTSPFPKSSPDWFPPTPVRYAILYHAGGYYVHDSWWRADYGPGTQFPHLDASGDVFSNNGSHGCINLQEQDATWLYQHTNWSTATVIY